MVRDEVTFEQSPKRNHDQGIKCSGQEKMANVKALRLDHCELEDK